MLLLKLIFQNRRLLSNGQLNCETTKTEWTFSGSLLLLMLIVNAELTLELPRFVLSRRYRDVHQEALYAVDNGCTRLKLIILCINSTPSGSKILVFDI